MLLRDVVTTLPASTPLIPQSLTRDYLLHHRLCPRDFPRPGVVRVAAAPDALLEDAVEDLETLFRCAIEVEPTSLDEVHRLIERNTVGSERSVELESTSTTEDYYADVRDLANEAPVVRYVNLLVREAYDAAASDIHLEARREGLTVRFRLDGVLARGVECPPEYHQAVVSRIKLLADLDIAERRKPQDGRIRVRLESRELDVRVSTVPTMHGESVVLRLLDRGGRPVTLEELGMSRAVLDSVRRTALRPHGLCLVTGPTGSGKTTTLYAALQLRALDREKVITVEDPIEYQLSGITQMPVHATAGVTFASALRSILRQDPDVIMIGEMRDCDTAEIAVQAAMTGHLVLSTLHTNDATSAIPRMIDLGIPEYLIAATVEGVLAQRLVRCICPSCREEYEPIPELLQAIGHTTPNVGCFYRGVGCGECRGTGFRGRTGLFEFLTVTPDVRDAVTRGATKTELRALAVRAGLVSLEHDAWRKIASAITTVEEVSRVVQE